MVNANQCCVITCSKVNFDIFIESRSKVTKLTTSQNGHCQSMLCHYAPVNFERFLESRSKVTMLTAGQNGQMLLINVASLHAPKSILRFFESRSKVTKLTGGQNCHC
jgi:hypothetical protein